MTARAVRRRTVEINYHTRQNSGLDWNKPSIDFYLGMGAKAMDQWTVYRIDGDRLNRMAEGQTLCNKDRTGE